MGYLMVYPAPHFEKLRAILTSDKLPLNDDEQTALKRRYF